MTAVKSLSRFLIVGGIVIAVSAQTSFSGSRMEDLSRFSTGWEEAEYEAQDLLDWLGGRALPTLTPTPPSPTSTSTPTGSPTPTSSPTENSTSMPPMIDGCSVFPGDNIWNVRVDSLPVDGNSSDYIATIGPNEEVHADFGSGEWPPGSGSPIGIPFTTVTGAQPEVSVSFVWDDESDPGPYPIPTNAPIEGGPNSDGDRHVIVLDTSACILFELFNAFPEPDGSWRAHSGAVFHLASNGLRPAGWTSGDAAGLPILPGLIRYDEAISGEIRHALRFTAPETRDEYVWPARHQASDLTDSMYPPMGQRFRLRSDFDTSAFSPVAKVIAVALQRYGMILADNGSPWYLSGAPDERWDNDVLHELDIIQGSDFEAVDVSSLEVDPNSGETHQP